jgi:hypothetical protein
MKKYNHNKVGAKSGKYNVNYVHGMSNHRFYRIWKGILSRSNNIYDNAYYRYGGRNIKCLWKSFKEFKNDMYRGYLYHIRKYGEKYTQLDRINNNSNYCKNNCKWVTPAEQNINKRNNVYITYKGKKLTISEWSKKLKVPPRLIRSRKIKLGWCDRACIETKVLTSKTRIKGNYYE